jgi:multidrug resistance efflux pump
VSAPPPPDEPPAPPPGRNPLFRSRATLPVLLIGVMGVLLILFAWKLPPFTSGVQTTEDAYVRGAMTVIAPKLDGYIDQVPVQDFQTVRAGQLLARIDERIPRQKLDQALASLASARAALANAEQQRRSAEANVGLTEAQIANARAQLAKSQADMRRTSALVRGGWTTPAQLDTTRAALQAAQAALQQSRAQREIARQNVTTVEVGRGSLEAAVQSAEAAVRLARIDLQNTQITAPRDGRLGEVGVRVGQYVTPGTQLMALVPDQVWVVANMKETQMARVRVGQPVWFRVDALNGTRLKGHVERISPAAGSEFSVIRPDNATGNFTKVAQRIPVRIRIDPGQPLARRLSPGMSVVVAIYTR